LGEIFERTLPAEPLEWTGERLTTATAGQVEVEHLHRYFLARDLCRGLDVLDIAAGEGYGTALLAQVARSVLGVEVSAEAVAHAAEAYRGPNFRFLQGDARRLPLDNASVDAVVSFETIEHFYEHDQFLAEVRRVLRPGGFFIVSSPERDVYSPSGSSANPYHVRELSRAEFSTLLCNSFAEVRILAQRPMLGSALVSEADRPGRTLTFEKRGPRHFEASVGLPRPVYFLAVASDRPVADVPDSLYIETAEIGGGLAAADVNRAASEELLALRGELTLCIQQADEQAKSYRQQLLVADQASHDHCARASALDAALTEARSEASALDAALTEARSEASALDAALTEARSEATAACLQRDIARTAARRAAAASEGHWRGRIAEMEQQAVEWQRRAGEAEQQAIEWQRRAGEAEQQAIEWQRRAGEAEQQAVEWRHRYEGLRARLEAILRRFWIQHASRLVPASARRFVRERLLGGGRL
jgi:SAM-dependent methyltransferase